MTSHSSKDALVTRVQQAFLPMLVVGVALLAVLYAVQSWQTAMQTAEWQEQQTNQTTFYAAVAGQPDRTIRTITVGDVPFTVEVVYTPESVEQGLSGRTSIGSDGMLFVFPELIQAKFWMKDMLFDLDMVWIASGSVVSILESIPKPEPDTALSDLPIYSAPVSVDMVLELPAGKAAELGISVGDSVRF